MQQEYVTVRLTKEEYDLLIKLRNEIAHRGLPQQAFSTVQARDVNEYLDKMNRDSLATGALVGLGIAALIYLVMTKK